VPVRLLSIVEATPSTGLGRLARALAVREALQEQGHELILAGEVTLPGAAALLEESEAALEHRSLDPAEIAQLAEGAGVNRVVIDCASSLDGLPELLAARGVRTAWIRDGSNPVHVPGGVDLVIAPEWIGSSSVETQPDGSVLARGPDYAPVRGSAREAAERRLSRAGGMGDRPRLVVLLGEERDAEAMLPVAEWVAASDVTADVLCVGGNDGQRRRAEVQSTRRVRVLATAWRSDLPRLVADHDLVVSFGRRFTWEIACIGTPMALLALGSASAPGLEAAASAGAAIWLGRPGDAQSPAGRLRAALRDGMRRRDVAARAARLVDGSGGRRVADLLTR
jgi:spore coat polysaccharide biosynthesis predicted glycosyltransferase SpsG